MDKNKILLVSSDESVFTQPCRYALEKLGYVLDYFNYRADLYFKNKLVRRLYRTIPGAKHLLKNRINRNFFKKVDSFGPDYVFALRAEHLLPEFLKKLKARDIITFNWSSEDIWPGPDKGWGINVRLASSYDFFFVMDPHLLRQLKQSGFENCYYLPFCADVNEQTSNPFQNRKEKYDIAMVASYSVSDYSNRTKYMESIKDLRLNIFGSAAWQKSSLKDCYRGTVTPDKVPDIYRHAKMVPNIHYDKTGSESEGINLRPFEAMAAGALLISDDSRAEMSKLFRAGEEFISFPTGNYEKFRELCKYYLDHSQERLQIAQNGYQSIIANHSYIKRMRQMMDIVESSINTNTCR